MAGHKDLQDIKSVEGLSKEELIRACRLSLQAELDASNFYEMIVEASDNAVIKDVIQEISNEEKVHAGEFLRLIKLLDPEETDKHHAEGAREAEGHMGSHGGPGPAGPMQGAHPPGYIEMESGFEEKTNKVLKDLSEEMDEALNKELEDG